MGGLNKNSSEAQDRVRGYSRCSGMRFQWVTSTFWSDANWSFAIEEVVDFASIIEFTWDCVIDFDRRFGICSDILSVKQPSFLPMYKVT